jgi:hypothetical protein
MKHTLQKEINHESLQINAEDSKKSFLEGKKIHFTDAETLAAAYLYLDRKARVSHPDGNFEHGKKWYPSAAERCWQCAYIREPSRSWPFSILTHCRSAEHIASTHSVDAKELLRIARLINAGESVKSVKKTGSSKTNSMEAQS